MSGRDLREFLQRKSSFATKPLSSDVVNRYASHDNLRPAFKKVDYDKMKEELEQYKSSGLERFGKVKSLAKKGSDSKTAALLKQHREAWLREKRKLEEDRKREEYDLEYIYGSALADSYGGEEGDGLREFWRDICEREGQYAVDRDVFRSEYVLGLLECGNKLKAHLHSLDGHVTTTGHFNLTEMKREIEKAAEQRALMSSMLNKQQSLLETEIEQLDTSVVSSDGSMCSGDEESSRIQSLQDLPADMLTAEGLSKEARQFVECELNQLSQHYLSALDKLGETHRVVLDGLPFAGWGREEHKQFCLVLEQYPPNLPSRRSIYLDRLKREFPQRSRADLVTHEEWHLSLLYYQRRREAYLHSWARDREDLLLRCQVALEEEREAERQAQEHAIERQRQLDTCHLLHQKLASWMERKLEAMKLDAAIAERVQVDETERKLAQEAREREERRRRKAQVKEYCREKEEKQALALEREKERLLLLQQAQAEQAKRDKERVVFRQEQRLKKIEDLQRQEALSQQAELERQTRLDRLREKVCISVAADPMRVLRDTEAYRSRLQTMAGEEKEKELQAPLFVQHGYTQDQIAADKRLKVEQALRSAGLHDSDYARKILSAVPPPAPPRRDMKSVVFKDVQS